MLFQLPLNGELDLTCLLAQGSYTAYLLEALFTVMIVWLLLNMLIAMMAKTFDDYADVSSRLRGLGR